MYLYQPIQRNATVAPNGLATWDGSRQHTWSQLRERVARLASALVGLGVRPQQRVAILALNSDRYYEWFYAVPWSGAVMVPLNIRWALAENEYALDDSEASVLFVDDIFLEQAQALQQRSTKIRLYVYLGQGEVPEGMLGYEALIAGAKPMPPHQGTYEEMAGIFYTGGTTGFPKGVMLSHTNLWTSSLAVAMEAGFNRGAITYLHAAPMFHLADICMLMASTVCGARQTFIPAFEPRRVVEAIQEYQVSHIVLVPTMITMMLASPALAEADLSCLEMVLYGASPMPEGTLKQAMASLPQASFCQVYGQTELAPMATCLRAEYHVLEGPKAGKLRSAGQPSYGIEIRIVGGDGEEQPRGQVGEITVKAPNAMMGYLNKPEQTARTLVDGWLHTGDAGYQDEEGFVYLVDRVKDMIVSGGENVYSAEVESALSKHPAVLEAVVIGIPSERWGEQVHAIVRLQPGQEASAEAIIEACKDHIAGYKCPRSVEFRSDPFPITGAGKIRKMDLRAPFWADKERNIH